MGLEERIAWGTPLEAGGAAEKRRAERGNRGKASMLRQVSDIVVSHALCGRAFAFNHRDCASGMIGNRFYDLKNSDKNIDHVEWLTKCALIGWLLQTSNVAK
jgi:hypothetical protein